MNTYCYFQIIINLIYVARTVRSLQYRQVIKKSAVFVILLPLNDFGSLKNTSSYVIKICRTRIASLRANVSQKKSLMSLYRDFRLFFMEKMCHVYNYQRHK